MLPTGSIARTVLEADGYIVHELPFVEISRRRSDLLRYPLALLRNGGRPWRLARRENAVVIRLNDFTT